MYKTDEMELHHNKPEGAAGATTVQRHHLGDGMTLSGLRRAISQVSMLVMKATTSGEAAWREECLKYALTSHPRIHKIHNNANETLTESDQVKIADFNFSLSFALIF